MAMETGPDESKIISFLSDQARAEPQIRALILFGSRARGDAHARSDFDIAVNAPGMTHAQWAAWAVSVREQFPSLVGVDLVLIHPGLSKELSEKIKHEGKLMYDKNP